MTQVVASNTNNIVKVYSVGLQGAPGAPGPTGSLQSSNSGSFSITGSLIVSGSNTFTNIGPTIFSGSVTSTSGFTGSLQGTSSFATSASYVLNAVSASFATSSSRAISSSFATTASFALNAGTTVSTASLLITGSATNNVLTFTKGDGSTFNLTVATGSGGGSTFPYSGTAQITGSLEILTTGSLNPVTAIGDAGIKVVRYSSAFGFPGSTWGGYLYPLSTAILYSPTGAILGNTKNPLTLQPLGTSQDVALSTVNYGPGVFISASNEVYLGYGSNSASKTYVRDLLTVQGTLSGSNAYFSGSINVTGSITSSGDIEITDSSKGIILRSPNGTRYRITINNSGILVSGSI
jgi:hypothetical protein